jgi:hypothetical protein
MRTFIKIFLLSFSFITTVFSEDLAAPELNLNPAVKQIIAKNNYKVLGAKIEVIEGKETQVIKILTGDGRVQNLRVDMETGKILDKPLNK